MGVPLTTEPDPLRSLAKAHTIRDGFRDTCVSHVDAKQRSYHIMKNSNLKWIMTELPKNSRLWAVGFAAFIATVALLVTALIASRLIERGFELKHNGGKDPSTEFRAGGQSPVTRK